MQKRSRENLTSVFGIYISQTANEVRTDEYITDTTAGLEPIKILNALRTLYGPSGAYKSDFQRTAVQYTLRLQPGENIIVVMPTGSGKSLLFVLPPLLSERITVVLIPLRALLEDISTRIRSQFGLVTIWNEQKTRNPVVHQILLASSDQLLTNTGLPQFLARLERENRLDRLVIDECHIYITAKYRFQRLQHIADITQRRAPIICLTATLPPRIESRLRDLLKYTPQNCTTLRTSSLRTNLRMDIYHFPSWNDILNELHGIDAPDKRKLLDRLCDGISSPRGIIYAITKANAEDIGSILKAPVYHSDISDRSSILEDFCTGTSPWIVGTSGLGAGLDIPGVSVVILFGMPHDVLDWYQMAGRAGRDSVEGRVIITQPNISPRAWTALKESTEANDPESYTLSRKILGITSCIRPILSTYLDYPSDSRSCNDISASQCWNCQTRPSHELDSQIYTASSTATNTVSRSRNAHFEETRQPKDMTNYIRYILKYYSEGCVFCRVMQDISPDIVDCDHSTSLCRRWEALNITHEHFNAGAKAWRRSISFQPGACCFFCACPRWVCIGRRPKGGTCEFGSVSWNLGYIICQHDELRRLWVQDAGVTADETWKAQGKRSQLGRHICSRLWVSIVEASRYTGLMTTYMDRQE